LLPLTQVVMVTGDHPKTAEAIAQQCNIIGLHDADNKSDSVVVTGPEMAAFTTEDWDRVCAKSEIVFARTRWVGIAAVASEQ
jgi:sodium/potassium-transporting ATPase subunit alpha